MKIIQFIFNIRAGATKTTITAKISETIYGWVRRSIDILKYTITQKFNESVDIYSLEIYK